MNYATIKYNDIANGLGVRVSLFVSGCTHRCKGCFNEIAWDFEYGNPFTKEVQNEIIENLAPYYVRGLTLLGGEPMEVCNVSALLPFIREFAKTGKDLWVYSGYTFEQLMSREGKAGEETRELLSYVDVLVDGPFVEEKKSVMLKFRGSSNQRLIDMKQTLKCGKVIPFEIKGE